MGTDDNEILVDVALKKCALVWIQRERATGDDSPHALWHIWQDGHIYLLTGPGEQPDPNLGQGEAVRVIVRSKDDRHLLLTLTALATRLLPEDADWDAATATLARSRLNLSDPVAAPTRWRDPAFVLYRLIPADDPPVVPPNP